MSDNLLNVTRDESTHVESCKSLKEIKAALKALDVYNRTFTYVTGMSDLITDEYTTFLFLSSKPTNEERMMSLPAGCTGKTLAVLLFEQYTNPIVEMYHLTKDAKLGGWELMAWIVEDDFILRADRVLLGSKKKSN